MAFLVCGVPGICFAVTVLRLNNPARGVNDNISSTVHGTVDSDTDSVAVLQGSASLLTHTSERSDGSVRNKGFTMELKDVVEILSNKPYMFATAGLVASTFAIGLHIQILFSPYR